MVITGGYAIQAHGLVDRPSQDLDVAIQNSVPMEEITATLSVGLTERGWRVENILTDPLSARLIVAEPTTGERCELDVLREALYGPPSLTQYGPVLHLDDVIGTKVRALADRGAARDLIDVFAAHDLYSDADLEALGRRHARDEFRLEELADRLRGAEWYEDDAFTAYGLADEGVSALRAWASAWADNISRRVAQDRFEEDSS